MNLAEIVNLGSLPAWATLALGFVLGLRHALEPDHVAAVSTFVTEERNPWRSSLIGTFWGVGHTTALLVFGLLIAIFRLAITPHLGKVLDSMVGLMLVILGVRVLFRLSASQAIHVHTHAHDGVSHSHLHFHLGDPQHDHKHHMVKLGSKPFVVGIVHGLAGTGAVMLLVIGAIPSLFLAVGTLLIFGLGTIGGMVLMSLLISVPLALAANRVMLIERLVRLAAGLFSLGFGLFLTWEVGWLQPLLR